MNFFFFLHPQNSHTKEIQQNEEKKNLKTNSTDHVVKAAFNHFEQMFISLHS